LDIGGMDNPVIKDSKGVPYIPGSTIKGKLRSILEKSYYPLRYKDENDGKGYFDERMTIHKFEEEKLYENDPITKIFGNPDVNEPGRGIFRDAFLDVEHFDENRTELFKNLELEFTEDKIENSVDRISARAVPRNLERVPRGTQFDFEIILDLYSDHDRDLVKVLLQGLRLLQDDYLGGSGTRGSGKVEFEDLTLAYRQRDFYTAKADQILLSDTFNLLDIQGEEWFNNALSKIKI